MFQISPLDTYLPFALLRIIKQDSVADDVTFPLGKVTPFPERGEWSTVTDFRRDEEVEDYCDYECDYAFDEEDPAPACPRIDSEDSGADEAGKTARKDVAEEEEGDTKTGFLLRIPGGEVVKRSRNEPCFAQSEEQTSGEVCSVALDKGLESGYEAPCQNLH